MNFWQQEYLTQGVPEAGLAALGLSADPLALPSLWVPILSETDAAALVATDYFSTTCSHHMIDFRSPRHSTPRLATTSPASALALGKRDPAFHSRVSFQMHTTSHGSSCTLTPVPDPRARLCHVGTHQPPRNGCSPPQGSGQRPTPVPPNKTSFPESIASVSLKSMAHCDEKRNHVSQGALTTYSLSTSALRIRRGPQGQPLVIPGAQFSATFL